jgi:hypothetical protein
MSQILKPADVVLVEGKRRISTAIKSRRSTPYCLASALDCARRQSVHEEPLQIDEE